MKKFFIYIALLLIIPGSKIAYAENLKMESESLAHAWFLGAGFIPSATFYFKDPNPNDDIDKKLRWAGYGFVLKSMYITGLHWQPENTYLFFSLNTNFKYIFWNEKQILEKENDEEIEHRFNGDKGYSIEANQSLRFNIIVLKWLGIFWENGINFTYLNPKNLDPDENIDKEKMPGITGGAGFYYFFPFYSPVILEFGVYGSYLKRKSDKPNGKQLSFEMSFYFEFY